MTVGFTEDMTNFDRIIATANIFKNSQGFYGRLLANIEDMKEYEPEQYEEAVRQINELPLFNDVLDVVMYLEC